jgi:AraC-like DNA-binding protein/quercetin dioxygenase-like cupin family protein
MSQKCQSVLFDRRSRRKAHAATLSFDFDHGHAIPEHSHPEDQLVFASQGVMTVRTRHGIWVVPPLRAVWIPAGTAHAIIMSGSVSMRTVYFLPRLARTPPQKCFVMNVSPLLKELILHACRFPKLNKKVAIERRILELLIDQLEAAHSSPLQLPHPSDARAARVMIALFADPGGQRTLKNLCRDCGASKRTIQRLWMAETKMAFGKWRQQLRLLHALQLLASGENVTGAALGSGYNSTSAFISMFRKQLGTTPLRYFAS